MNLTELKQTLELYLITDVSNIVIDYLALCVCCKEFRDKLYNYLLISSYVLKCNNKKSIFLYMNTMYHNNNNISISLVYNFNNLNGDNQRTITVSIDYLVMILTHKLDFMHIFDKPIYNIYNKSQHITRKRNNYKDTELDDILTQLYNCITTS